MSGDLIEAIAAYSKDRRKSGALERLMDYAKSDNLASIPDSVGREFLDKLKSGEIAIKGYVWED